MFRRIDEPEPPEAPHEARELVTLASLIAEGFAADEPSPLDALARQLGDDVILDDIGRRSVTRETARRLLAERAAAQAALEARRAAKAKAEADREAAQGQVDRAAAARRAEAEAKVRAVLGPDASALEVMKALDGTRGAVNNAWDARLDEKADELLTGQMAYHRIRDENE